MSACEEMAGKDGRGGESMRMHESDLALHATLLHGEVKIFWDQHILHLVIGMGRRVRLQRVG